MRFLLWTFYCCLLFSPVALTKKHERPRKLLEFVPGGRERCLREISARAAFLRGGIQNTIHEFDLMEGAYGYVIQVNFHDGVQWAAKISSNINRQFISDGKQATEAIETYCPGIPLPKYHGQLESIKDTDLVYCFMDWIRGRPLTEIVRYHSLPHVDGMNYTFVESTIPRRTIRQLAEFVYNLTTCPIPIGEVTKLIAATPDALSDNGKMPASPTWFKARLIYAQGLLRANTPPDGFDGLDKFLLVMSNYRKLSRYQPFVLNYRDLRAPNILVDALGNIQGVIDWDGVAPAPIGLSAIDLAGRLYIPQAPRESPYWLSLDPKQNIFFLEQLQQIERERSGSTRLSRLFLKSAEHVFLDRLLLKSLGLPYLIKIFHDRTIAALSRDRRSIAAAKWEWEQFKDAFFTRQGRPLPDWPVYNDIETALGYNRGKPFERKQRDARRKLLRRLRRVLHGICIKYPGLRWAEWGHCHINAALSDTYIFANGKYSC